VRAPERDDATTAEAPDVPRALSECLNGEVPLAVRLVDIEQGLECLCLPVSPSGMAYRRLLALLREGGRPLGWVELPVEEDGTVALGSLDAAMPRRSGGAPPREEVQSYELAGPDRARATTPMISIVVTTCANVELVLRCVEAIRTTVTDAFEIIVVENRPAHSTVAQALAERFAGDPRVRYAEEERPGLSRARNAGLREARGEIVVFTDDDIVVDTAWASAVREAFTSAPEVDCVTGLILPLELETAAQLLVERFASFGKGFAPRVYSLADPPADQPLFPYTAGYFGSGANIAFRTDAARALGGFDPRLGAGTPARAGEDLDICIRLLQSGRRLAYEPRAIVWHPHPDTDARLRRQVFGYGVGLGAMLCKQLLGPGRWKIVSRAPQGLRYFADPSSRKNAGRGPTFPRRLNRLELSGVAFGPVAYLTSLLQGER
jgi:GT2 family glycosyltransferase